MRRFYIAVSLLSFSVITILYYGFFHKKPLSTQDLVGEIQENGISAESNARLIKEDADSTLENEGLHNEVEVKTSIQDSETDVVQDAQAKLASLRASIEGIDFSENPSDGYKGVAQYQAELARMIESGEITYGEAIEFLMSVPSYAAGPTAQVVTMLFPADEISKDVIERLPVATGDAKGNLLALLSQTGTHSAEERQVIISQFDALADPRNYGTAVLSITPINVEPAEREELRQLLNAHVDHPEPQISAATITVMDDWRFTLQPSTINSGLLAEDSSTRRATMAYILNTGAGDDVAKSALVKIMNSEDKPFVERVEAHSALTVLDLDGSDYADHHKFTKTLESLMNNR